MFKKNYVKMQIPVLLKSDPEPGAGAEILNTGSSAGQKFRLLTAPVPKHCELVYLGNRILFVLIYFTNLIYITFIKYKELSSVLYFLDIS